VEKWPIMPLVEFALTIKDENYSLELRRCSTEKKRQEYIEEIV
jgi:hypothetical protein